ncbi:SCO family protein [Psychrobacillus sp. OK032]|uniref:SCO family protein n=1 Tax=Psychrobacillus sp. OK032 TaxID=1884358 RepID=UPI0008C8980D|nr:SCO family protein [Psychrobacillus sp. OK032]SES11887.1 protein SCO1/2 [Psychrobacillus sp. OK032]
MKKLLAMLSITLLILAGCGSGGNFEAQTNWKVEDFNYENQRGEAVSLDDLKGTVWLASFIYTNCTTECPLMTFNMSDIQKELVDKGIEDYKIVSFSADPEFDTPEVLQEYIGNFEVPDESKWNLLTGYAQKDIKDFAANNFQTAAIKNPNTNEVMHGISFYLVDQNGVVVKNYNGYQDVPTEEIVMDVETLIADGQ